MHLYLHGLVFFPLSVSFHKECLLFVCDENAIVAKKGNKKTIFWDEQYNDNDVDRVVTGWLRDGRR